MGDSASALPQTILFLYDATGHILHVTDTHPPYSPATVVNLPAWHAASQQDAMVCQSAVLLCLQSGQPQTFDIEVAGVGRWRTTLHRCQVGKVRLIGMARKFPQSVLRLTSKQREICALLASGKSSREIAADMDRARETIDNHRAAIAKRLGLKPWSLVAWRGEHREWF